MAPETLVLVPTRGELEFLRLGDTASRAGWHVALCGFGPVAAACRTMQLLCSGSYARVFLCGLAGTYSGDLGLGDVVTFRSVMLEGVGAIEGGLLRSGYDLGFDTSTPNCFDDLVPHSGARCAAGLLTVCVCSGTAGEAAGRAAMYPGVTAEDMEGYGVAMACHLQAVPLTILRGVSNRAGDRDKQNWKIADALNAVRSVLESTLRP